MTNGKIFILDLAAKIDQCAEFLCKAKWGDVMEFPPPFGRDALPEVCFFFFFLRNSEVFTISVLLFHWYYSTILAPGFSLVFILSDDYSPRV